MKEPESMLFTSNTGWWTAMGTYKMGQLVPHFQSNMVIVHEREKRTSIATIEINDQIIEEITLIGFKMGCSPAQKTRENVTTELC